MSDCVFCKIVAGQIPATRVYEDEHTLAFMDIGQVNPGRLSLMASQVSDAYGTKTRVDPKAVWNGSLLPSAAELNVLPPAKK